MRSKPLALPHIPHLWLRFVDDMYVIQKAEHSQLLLQHISSKDSHIQFTMEEPNNIDGSLPFLDTQVTPGSNNTLITTVCRKPTHTDQYLHLDNNHFIGAKHSFYNTLAHRVKLVSHNQKELQHIREALQACQFPSWTLLTGCRKFDQQHHNNIDPCSRDTQLATTTNNGTSNTPNNRNISIVVSYIHGLGERFKKTCRNKEIQVHCKGTNTVKTLLIAPKDKGQQTTEKWHNRQVHIHPMNCPEQYIGECGRTLGDS